MRPEQTTRYDNYECTKETRRACYEELTTSKINEGKDLDNFFSKVKYLQMRLDHIEVVSDHRFEYTIIQAIDNDYKYDYLRQTSFRIRGFGLEKPRRR